MPDKANWYVVHTYSGYEKKVVATIEKTVASRKLQEYILEMRIPTEEVVEIGSDGKKKNVERKVFPGYVLVKMVMNDESWHAVRNTRGVTGFVGSGSKPIPLTESEVSALGVEKVEIIVPYDVGDSVKIIDGPLNTFIGTVEELETSKNLVRVVISLFGRETPVELELEQVEPLVV